MTAATTASRHIGIIASGIWGSIHLDMAHALKHLGCRVSLFTLDDARAESRARLTRIEQDGLRFFIAPASRRHPAWWWLDKLAQSPLRTKAAASYAWALRGFLRANPDLQGLLVESDHPWGWLTALALRGRQLPWILTVHDVLHLTLPFPVPRHLRQPLIQRMKQWSWKQASLVRANSPVTREVLLHNHCPPTRLRTLPLHALQRWAPYPLDDASLLPMRTMARTAVLERYQLLPDTRLLVSMCRMSPEKGLDRIAQALPQVLARHPNTVWLACGPDRGIQQEVLRLLDVGQARHAVRFCGNLGTPQAMEHLMAADLHLAPSYVDTFNYAVLEAARAGTPSLVSAQVGCAGLAASAGCAEIVDCGMPSALATAITGRRAGADALPEAARRRVFQAVDPEYIAQQLMAWLAT